MRNLLFCLFAFLSHYSPSAGEEATAFKTGKQMESAMMTKVSWAAEGTRLTDQLRELQQQSGVAILKDRRLDPNQLISVKTDFVPRIQVLRQISENIPGGAFWVTDHFAFVGPTAAASRLPILLERNIGQMNLLSKKLPATQARQVLRNLNPYWEHLAEPKEILLDASQAAGIAIKNPENIPHDVWPAGQVPESSIAELATVILNQFNLTFRTAGDAPELTIVPIDPDEVFEHRYSVGSKLKSRIASEWKDRAPSADIRWSGSSAVVTATLGQHGELNAVLGELRFPAENGNATTTGTGNSLRTRNYQLSALRLTVGQLIGEFQNRQVPIEVLDAESAETKAILNELVQIEKNTEKLPGTKFFPQIFGRHFKRVDVQDDRVVLSRE